MKPYGDMRSVSYSFVGGASTVLLVSGRCRLRMVIPRSARPGIVGNSALTLLLKNGSDTADVLYEVSSNLVSSVALDAYALSNPIDLGEHGILFTEGIFAKFELLDTIGSWCDRVVLIYEGPLPSITE